MSVILKYGGEDKTAFNICGFRSLKVTTTLFLILIKPREQSHLTHSDSHQTITVQCVVVYESRTDLVAI